jgi:hypothetical protein
MLHVDIPTLSELKDLARQRGEVCASLYLPTTPLTQDAQADRIALKTLAKAVVDMLTAAGRDKRSIAAVEEQVADIVDDDAFWRVQAHGLAVLATPETVRTFRLPIRVAAAAEVADRFHLKPLLHVLAFPREAFVLVLSENAVRLAEVTVDLAVTTVAVDGLPKDAASAAGRATLNDRSPRRRLQGSEGQKVLLRQYARQVDGAVRPILAGREVPLLLAAAEPLASIYRSVNSYPLLAADGIAGSSDRTTDADLATAARVLLDRLDAATIADARALFAARKGQRRTTTALDEAARAAVAGAIDTLLMDMDRVVPGTVDDDGRVVLADAGSAATYGVVDEIARRALLTGARVLSVRADDVPDGAPLAAILRTPL